MAWSHDEREVLLSRLRAADRIGGVRPSSPGLVVIRRPEDADDELDAFVESVGRRRKIPAPKRKSPRRRPARFVPRPPDPATLAYEIPRELLEADAGD